MMDDTVRTQLLTKLGMQNAEPEVQTQALDRIESIARSRLAIAVAELLNERSVIDIRQDAS